MLPEKNLILYMVFAQICIMREAFSDPLYYEFQRKYVLYKSILRKTFVNWISSGIVNL